ncbi:MAG: flavin reductase [Anaerolineales bacterium]|nr:flavin reductase [Anaerolineales bacterium]
MTERIPIPIEDFLARPYSLWEKRWLLLSSGDLAAGDFNCMTVSWGSLGQVWNRPLAQIFVRPQRYTYQFMEKYATFTLCAFAPAYREALNLLGTRSGRDGDKLAAAGLTPAAATAVAAPVYDEAELTIECRKMFWQDFGPPNFVDPSIERNYPTGDYHRIYFGEIVAVTGSQAFVRK